MEKIWLKQYNNDIPEEITSTNYGSLIELFNDACSKFNKNTAFSCLGLDYSFEAIEKKSRDLAAYLQSLGIKKGARIAVMMPNLIQYPIAIFAILRAGYIVVNVNPLYTAHELTHQLNDSGAQAIIVLANFEHTVQKCLPELTTLNHVVVTQVGDLHPPFKKLLINLTLKYLKKVVPKADIPFAMPFLRALDIGAESSLQEAKAEPQDMAFLQYTGGTTGLSKGAILTHANILANTQQAVSFISSGKVKLTSDDVVVTALPLYHIFSLTANCIVFLSIGAKNLLIPNPRNTDQFINDLKKNRFTLITGVNTLFNTLLHHPEFEKLNFSNLKYTLSGGMSLQRSVFDRWKSITKNTIVEAYGLSETSPAVSINDLKSAEFTGSIGLPIPSTEISIRNDNGEEVAINEQGELCVKGPQVMQGYWQRPEETKNSFTKDGFFKTGDIARMDERGYLYLVDRKKDMILVSGFNVYPNEVEQVLSKHSGILEVGVTGVPCEKTGEAVKACVVRKNPNLTKEEIIEFAKQNLTPYKVPKIIEFWQELPKTNVGKILRRALNKKEESLTD